MFHQNNIITKIIFWVIYSNCEDIPEFHHTFNLQIVKTQVIKLGYNYLGYIQQGLMSTKFIIFKSRKVSPSKEQCEMLVSWFAYATLFNIILYDARTVCYDLYVHSLHLMILTSCSLKNTKILTILINEINLFDIKKS